MVPKPAVTPFAASTGQRQAPTGPLGVIDIGSNSIRLVVFQAIERSPTPIFNEKFLCGIGRNLDASGILDPVGVERARLALARFRAVADALGVAVLEVVATAAVREAGDGAAFVAEAEALCGVPVRVLTGQQEGALATDGVLAGIPDAAGLVGDLGGGSLELTEVIDGRQGRAVTLPLGPLRLIDRTGGKMGLARRFVTERLAAVDWLDQAGGNPLYVVGGVWRALARIHMGQRNYPLHILQNYTMPAEDSLAIAKLISGLSRKSLENLDGLARRRIETVPFGALVLEQILLRAKCRAVIVSAFGLREGLLFSLLSDEQRKQDPLLESARNTAQTMARSAKQCEELIAWTAPILRDEPAEDTRLRHAACLLSDMHWRLHPDYRAEHAFTEILRAPFAGIDHGARVFLALAVYHRYTGTSAVKLLNEVHAIAGEERAKRALQIGLALRLGHTLSASMPGILPVASLRIEGEALVLAVPETKKALAGETVEKRLAALAAALQLTPRIQVVAG